MTAIEEVDGLTAAMMRSSRREKGESIMIGLAGSMTGVMA